MVFSDDFEILFLPLNDDVVDCCIAQDQLSRGMFRRGHSEHLHTEMERNCLRSVTEYCTYMELLIFVCFFNFLDCTCLRRPFTIGPLSSSLCIKFCFCNTKIFMIHLKKTVL